MLIQFVIRNLRKHPFTNFIKILGLALGLSGVLFIALSLKNELTYDTFHSKADRIYRFTITNPVYFGNNHFARIYNSEQVPGLAAFFPEIESYVRLAPVKGGVMMHGEQYYSINEAFECDSTFFQVFDADLLVGDKNSVLETPGSMVISESFARKVFGNTNPVGQMISLPAGQYYGQKFDFTVKGVMQDFPQNSHFHPDLVATPTQGKISWWAYTYLLLKKHANPENIVAGYPRFLAGEGEAVNDGPEIKAYLQKITAIHLHSDKLREIENNGNMTYIYVLSVAAFLLLLISISNFAGLNLGMAGFNSKFVAVNRVLGATRQIHLKYLSLESLLIVATSAGIALLIAVPVNVFIGRHFGIHLFKGNTMLVVFAILIFGLLSVSAGIQPVLKQGVGRIYRPGFNPVNKYNRIAISKGILVLQYTFAIILVAAVLVISRQTRYALSHSMGMSQDNIICIERVHANIQQKFEVFKTELLKHNAIESVSAMLEPPGGEANDMFSFEMEGYQQTGEKERNMIGVFPCDYSFASLFNLNFLSGNNFSESNTDVDGAGEYIINETAMHFLNFTKPDEIVGKSFKLNASNPGINLPQGKITGVVKDFHLSSLKKKVGPLVLFKRDRFWLLNFVIACKPGMRKTALADIRAVWETMFPSYPLSCENVGAMYRNVYRTELLQEKLLSVFTFISLFISSMGLLGLSLLITQQRVKEIGIRKVNGAKISEVMVMLNRDFVKWVFVAFVIATPIAYYAMSSWLENFVYKTNLRWWIFAFSGLLALGIALLTVSWQSWKAATCNPVEALRNE